MPDTAAECPATWVDDWGKDHACNEDAGHAGGHECGCGARLPKWLLDRVNAALADLDSITARHRRGVSHRDECGTCNETYPCQTVQAVIRIRRTLTPEETTMPNPTTTTTESDPELLDLLRDAGRRWGPLGVALAAASLTDREALARKLTGGATGEDADHA